MNKMQFKRLIKECLREVLKEELSILKEELQIKKPIVENKIPAKFNYKEFIMPSKHQIVAKKPIIQTQNRAKLSSNPIENILNETAKNMTHDDFQSFSMNPSSMVESSMPMYAPNMNIGEVEEYFPQSMNLPKFPS